MNPQRLTRDPRRQRMLIYAGVAGAILLMFLLSRRQAAAAAASGGSQALQPVSNPAVDPSQYYGSGSGAGGVDYGPQLATIDTDLQTLGQAIQAQQTAAQTPGATTPGTGGGDPTSQVTALIGAISAAQSAGAGIYAQALSAARQPGPGNTPPAPPPTRPAAPAVGSALSGGAIVAPYGHNAPAGKVGYKTVGTGGGGWEYVPLPKTGTVLSGGAIVAAYGHNAPPPKAGYRVVGTGSGGWQYVPVKR